MADNYVIQFENLRMTDVGSVGDKDASLGRVISQLTEKGVRVPGGFTATAGAYRTSLAYKDLSERISTALAEPDIEDVAELTRVSKETRQWILNTPFPRRLDAEIEEAWSKTTVDVSGADVSVAMRSSAIAEDLPDTSFAGQQETLPNVNGLDNVRGATHHTFVSLYSDHAISYRVYKGFVHDVMALSANVQRMVRSGSDASGVIFTLDIESGYNQVIFVTSSYGLGENVAQGAVSPDELYVFKPTSKAGKPAVLRKIMGSEQIKMIPADRAEVGEFVMNVDVPEKDRNRFSISGEEITELAHYTLTIEKHHGRPMDIEWDRDSIDNELYVLQTRPETVKPQEGDNRGLRHYAISGEKNVSCQGYAVG